MSTSSAAAPGSSRRWLTVLLSVLGLALVGYLVSRVPLGDIGAAWATMGWAALLTVPIGLGWFAANTCGMYVMFKGRVPWRALFANRMMGEGYNAIIPLAGMAGEPLKIRHLSAFVSSDEAVAVVFLDRVITTLSSLLFSGAFIAAAIAVNDWPHQYMGPAALYVVVAAIASIALGLVGSSRVPQRLGGWVGRRLGNVDQAGLTAQLETPLLLRALLWHLLGRFVMVLEVILLLALLDLRYDLWTVVIVTGLVSAAGVLAFLIPGSLGVAEASAVLAFHLVGYSAALGIAFGLVRRGRNLAISLLGVGVHVAHHTARGPR